ncbi:MAG: hypothetical protein LC792_10745 [Actinobacteria bacterium]|nr:hypothetical protein [Actinomycetota bacterium]
MNTERTPRLRTLEGRHVTVALRDGSRLEDCRLISASRPGTGTVWIFAHGIDVFLPASTIVGCWEAPPPPHRRAA